MLKNIYKIKKLDEYVLLIRLRPAYIGQWRGATFLCPYGLIAF